MPGSRGSDGRVCSKDGGGGDEVLRTPDAREKEGALGGSRLLSERSPQAGKTFWLENCSAKGSWTLWLWARVRRQKNQNALGGVVPRAPKLSPLPPISATESLLGREAPCPSSQRLSSTYSAALLRADINQAPSKPSPRHHRSLPQTQITAPLPSRLPVNFEILGPRGSFKLLTQGYRHPHPAPCATRESGSQDHLCLVTHQLTSEHQHPPSSLLPARRTQPPKSPELPCPLPRGCGVSPAPGPLTSYSPNSSRQAPG